MSNKSKQISELIHSSITDYFATLDGTDPSNIYSLVLNQIEKPLIESVMQYANNNQSKAANWLGLSRNTLRKLLEKYNL